MARWCKQCGRDIEQHPKRPQFFQYIEEWDWTFTFGPLIRVCDVVKVKDDPPTYRPRDLVEAA